MHREGTSQSTMSAYVRKKTLNPGRKIECTGARIGVRFSTCNVDLSQETLKRCCVDICCLRQMRWKGQMEMAFNFTEEEVAKQKTVQATVANWSIGKVLGVDLCNFRVMKVNTVIGM